MSGCWSSWRPTSVSTAWPRLPVQVGAGDRGLLWSGRVRTRGRWATIDSTDTNRHRVACGMAVNLHRTAVVGAAVVAGNLGTVLSGPFISRVRVLQQVFDEVSPSPVDDPLIGCLQNVFWCHWLKSGRTKVLHPQKVTHCHAQNL